MKKFVILLSFICFLFASDFIPFEKVETLAQRFVRERFGTYYLAEVITYYGLDELPNAYAMVYKNIHGAPLTVVVGARYTCTPISEFSEALPKYYKTIEKARVKARELLGAQPTFKRIYYFGPQEEYFSFECAEKEFFINTYSLKVFEKDFFLEIQPERDATIEAILRQKWDGYFRCSDFTSRQTGYVDSVPFIDWVYGCSPTAASMLLWYWDSRGYGRLVDHFYTHWDYPEDEWNDCANVNRELALAMGTDSMTGGTAGNNIIPGYITTANSINGYSFSGTSYYGNAGNQYAFAYIENEIDNQRPFHWSVQQYWSPPHSDYIYHSLTGVGYDIILPDTFVIVHNTWDNFEPSWALWTYVGGVYSYDYVRVVLPGGAVTDNIFLEWPRGEIMSGGVLSARSIIFTDLNYRLRWQSVGSNIDHVKMWYSTGRQGSGYDSLYWTLIDDNLPNTGDYLWTCPDDDTLRINICGLNSSNTRLAADGSFGRCVPTILDHSPEINLVGHLPDADGYTRDIQVLGNYAFIADGQNGLVVADIADSSLPEQAGHLPLPGYSYCIAVDSPYLYIGDQEDTLRVISISDPTNPTQLGICAVGDEALDVYVVDSLVFVAARSQGLVIVNVSNPNSPSIIEQCDTPGFSFDVFVDGNYAYVADATKGVRTIDVSTPNTPVETGSYDTNGISYGVTKSGNYVYLADGTRGIKTFDGSSPDTLILLDSLDTPATATKVRFFNNTLFVADGNYGGIRVIDVLDPNDVVELGYIESKGTAGSLWLAGGSMVYLADGIVGTLVITQEFVGIAEDEKELVHFVKDIFPSHAVTGRVLTFSFNATGATRIEMKLFDVAGRLVETIYKGVLSSGNNKISWQPQNIPAGVYFVHTQAGDFRDIHKLVLVK